MHHVATLICDPAKPSLDNALLARAVAGLRASQTPIWLDPGIAADIVFEANDALRAVAETLREKLAGHPIDVVVQPLDGRRKKLFMADMDSTMIRQECIDELADFVGKKAHVAAITERAMRGEIAFEPALRERVALLAGLPAETPARVLAERIVLMPGGRALVQTMRAAGAYTALVSGGFTAFTEPVTAMIGFHETQANILLAAEGRLTGFVAEPILGKEAKLAALLRLRQARGLLPHETLAVGDGANDLAMLGKAGLGVAFHAKPAVAAAAHARIDHGDLTALLYLQGYSRGEFIET